MVARTNTCSGRPPRREGGSVGANVVTMVLVGASDVGQAVGDVVGDTVGPSEGDADGPSVLSQHLL